MKITMQTLTDAEACEDAREWFTKVFPNGGTKAQVIKACPQGDWLIWGLWNLKAATIEQVIMLGCVAGRRSLRFAGEQDKAVLIAAFDAADAVADDNNEQTRSAAWSAAWLASVESAAWSAWSAWSASGSAEHLACADAMRGLMRTARYKRAGKKP